MTRDGKKASSIATNLSKLRKVLAFLRSRGFNVLDSELIELPKVNESRKVFLDYSEIQHFINAAKRPRDKAIIACLFSTGCRISELLSLDRDDVKTHTNEIVVLGKGSKFGTVYIDGKARYYLESYLDTRTDRLKPLFLSGQCRRITQGRVNQIFHEIINTTDIEKRVTPHVMRHSYATDLLINGADIREVQEMLRHENLASTQVYTHVTDTHKKKVFARYHSV